MNPSAPDPRSSSHHALQSALELDGQAGLERGEDTSGPTAPLASHSSTSPSSTTPFPPPPDLHEPAAFSHWWREGQVVLGLPARTIIAALEAVGTHVSFLRASQVAGHTPEALPLAKRYASRALESPDHAVRLFALFRLTLLETKLGYGAGNRDIRGAPTALPLLRSLLTEIESSTPRDQLLVEVEARVHKALGEGYLMTGEYERAEAHLGRAVVLSDALGLRSLVHHARFLLGQVVFHAGRIAEANRRFQLLANDAEAEPVYSLDAQLFLAQNALWLGDDNAALAILADLASQPGRPEHYPHYHRCALALAGRGGLDDEPEAYGRYLPHELAAMFRSHQLLLRATERRRSRERGPERLLEEVRVAIENFRATTGWLRVMSGYLRSLASLRLGEVGLAADLCPDAQDAQDEHVAVRALALGLALEIGLHYQGRDVVPLAQVARQLGDLLSDTPAPSRHGVAQRLKVFLPLGGAFLAYSPHSVPEVLNACGPAVMDFTVKPIAAYGRRGLRPSHGVRWTLEAFGYPPDDRSDGGGQLEAEQAVLLQPHGEREHWFTPVPPAQLVYQYLRLHELAVGSGRLKAMSPWRRSALDVARTHGLLPSGREDSFPHERRELGSALKLLLAGDLTVAAFRTLVSPGP